MINLEGQRIALEKTKAELIANLKTEEKPEDFGDDTDNGPDSEEADEAESLANKLSIGQAMRNRITEIDEALAAIAGGTYGICTKCGGTIEPAVLHIVPESRLCEHCKKS